MKTHLVIDEFFGDAVFDGTYEQCQTWKIKNGHHYYIRPMTEVESGYIINLNDSRALLY